VVECAIERATVWIRLIVASQAGAPSSPWNVVWTRTASMAAICQPVVGLNAARSSLWLMGCGTVSGAALLKHNT